MGGDSTHRGEEVSGEESSVRALIGRSNPTEDKMAAVEIGVALRRCERRGFPFLWRKEDFFKGKPGRTRIASLVWEVKVVSGEKKC